CVGGRLEDGHVHRAVQRLRVLAGMDRERLEACLAQAVVSGGSSHPRLLSSSRAASPSRICRHSRYLRFASWPGANVLPAGTWRAHPGSPHAHQVNSVAEPSRARLPGRYVAAGADVGMTMTPSDGSPRWVSRPSR